MGQLLEQVVPSHAGGMSMTCTSSACLHTVFWLSYAVDSMHNDDLTSQTVALVWRDCFAQLVCCQSSSRQTCGHLPCAFGFLGLRKYNITVTLYNRMVSQVCPPVCLLLA